MNKRGVKYPWIIRGATALILLLPCFSNAFSLTSIATKLTSQPCVTIVSPICPIRAYRQTPLYASDESDLPSSEDDLSGSPFDERENPNAISNSLRRDSVDSSWSPFDDGSDRPTRTSALQQQSELFTSEPKPAKRLDSLVATLTRVDPEIANVPTRDIPLFGEVPVDGTLLLLVPVTLIAVLGLVLTIYIGYDSRDLIADEMEKITTVMSSPPVKDTVVTSGCRGLCSDQAGQLEYMRGIMESLAPSNK